MKINARAEKMEQRHVRNLRYKLRRDLPEEMAAVSNYCEAEHRKAVSDSIHKHRKHRSSDKTRAINYEMSLIQT